HMERYCERLKTNAKAGQASMSRDRGIFAYEAERCRQQFASFVIQEENRATLTVISVSDPSVKAVNDGSLTENFRRKGNSISRLLSVQASTVASESAFSTSGKAKNAINKHPFAAISVNSGITDIKFALTEKALRIFYETYHIPDEVHPQLPNLDQTIHEMPTGKIGVYTRFFEYANFRLPLSTFFVDVLRYYRIHISQLSVIGAAKVSHFEVLCRAHGFEPTVGLFRCLYVNSKNKGWMSFSKRLGNDAVCYTKPLDSLKNWNDRSFWVDAFACPASFPWNTSKSVPKDPSPKSFEFNAEHYATLVAHPAPFHKYPEPFLCLVGINRYYTLDENTYPQFLRDDDEEMDLLSFIRTADPIKVRIGERQRGEDEPKLLDTTVGRTVPLLPVAPARAESKLDASVDRLFDEGGSGTQAEQGDSAGGGGGGGDEQDIVIHAVISVVTTAVEDDHETLSGASVGGKSKSVVQQLLVEAVQNAMVRGEPIPTLPFVTSSVSATPEREDEDHTDSLAGANLRTIGAPPSVPLMTMTTTVTSTVDPTIIAKEKLVESSVFGDGSSSGADYTIGGFSGLTGGDFLVGGIRTVVSPDTDVQKVYVPQWSISNGSRLDNDCTCCEMVDEFAPPRLSAVIEEKNLLLKTRDEEVANLKAQLLVKEAEAMEAIRLRAEVQTLADHNIVLEREKGELDIKVADLAATVKVREQEVANLDAMVTSVKFHNDNLTDQVHKLEASSALLQDKVTTYDNFMGQLEKFHDDRIREMNENFNKLDTDLVELALHLEERFYPRLLTIISGRRWLLTHGLELAIAKCLNSTEYLSSLGAAIGKAVEKGMQEGLSVGITHGAAGRVLTDVAAYNPSAEADYLSALQRLQSVNFSLISELKSNKDASIDTIMNLLRLEDSLAERLNLAESQPHVDQLMVPIYHSPDQTAVGATSLSSALHDVFVLLVEPLSIAALEGTADDYEIVHTDGQEEIDADGQTSTSADVNPFHIIDVEWW
ncbi:hypothetical protein Tco_1061221, partial [Tanacetum coccineum]